MASLEEKRKGKPWGSLSPREKRILSVLSPLLLLIVIGCFFILPPLFALSTAAVIVIAAGAAFVPGSAHPSEAPRSVGTEGDQLRSIIEAMSDALVVYDAGFRVLFFNPVAEKLFGISAEKVVGRVIAAKDVELPEFRRFAQTVFPTLAPTMVRTSPQGEYPQVVDISFESPVLELRTITSPMMGEDGSPRGFLKIVNDRTREVSLMKSKTEFITVASHQLRTPLTNVQWVLETLAKSESVSGSDKDLLGTALDSAHQLSIVVEELLNISKIEEGRFGYEFKEADVTDFVGRILSEAMPQARRLGISLYFDRPNSPLPKVFVDEQKLSMAVSNLLDNAIRYNVENGKVTVSVKQDPEKPFVTISIADTGIGIPDEEVEKLFNKFFRGSNAVRTVAEGTGLGLYITQNIVAAHGGTVWAESELNRGTTFHVNLPTDFSLVPKREAPVEY